MHPVHPAPLPPLAPTLEALPLAPRRALERLAALGLRHVQLSATQGGLRPRDLDRSARRDLAAILRRHELAVSGIDAWIPAAHFLDAARVDRAVALVVGTIGLAEDLGRCPVSLTLPAASGIAGAILGPAAQRGVHVADHAVTPSPDAAVGIDPVACLAADVDPAAVATAAGPRLASARLADLLTSGMRGPIGSVEARLDVLAYRVALSVADYDRAVVVDVRQWVDPWGGLTQTREAWR